MKYYPNLLFLIFLVPLYCCEGPHNRLPGPTGPCAVGIDYLSFVDSSRQELFINDPSEMREITVKVWYPARVKAKPELYFEDPDLLVEPFQYTEIFSTLRSNSSLRVPVCEMEERYPVLIFSHGWGEHFSQSTILMEELASHGYFVFSLAHHYECKFSFYPDGSFIALDPSSERFQKIMQEQQPPEVIELFHRMYEAKDDRERFTIFSESNRLMPTFMKQSPSYWAEDIDFLIDQLDDIVDINERFKGRLDLDRIGVFGMSMGGMATNNVCIHSDKVKAGINIEGGLFGDLLDTTLNVPFMFLNGKRFIGYSDLFVGKSTADCYSVTLMDADHYNFTDYSIYPTPSTEFLLGEIQGNEAVELTNEIVMAFFDKYIKGDKDTDLEGIIEKHQGIEYRSNTRNHSQEKEVSLLHTCLKVFTLYLRTI